MTPMQECEECKLQVNPKANKNQNIQFYQSRDEGKGWEK